MYVVEYSWEQNYFHIEQLDDCLRTNRGAFFADQRVSYAPLGIFREYSEARKFCDACSEWRGRYGPDFAA